jgi:hypothetical protein
MATPTPSLLAYDSPATLAVAVGIASGGTMLLAAPEATTRAAPHDHHDEVVRASAHDEDKAEAVRTRASASAR